MKKQNKGNEKEEKMEKKRIEEKTLSLTNVVHKSDPGDKKKGCKKSFIIMKAF